MQTPISANSHYEVQQKIALTSTAAVKKLWGRMGSEFDQSWAQIRQPVLQVVQNGRLAAATDASRYTGQVLAETGQAAAPFGAIIPAAFVEYTPTGTDVGAYLDSAVVRSKQAVASGADIRTALRTGGDWLTGSLLTMFADTARDVVSADIAQRPKVTGYVRMLNTPSCARCVILAGKWFRWNEGFLRHPRCDCRHIPASEDVAGSYQTDPYEYFKSLSVRDQEKLFGKREAEAIRDYGADIYRTMNIKMRGLGTAKSNRIYGTPNKRTVNDILSRDPSRKYVIENLQYHGYITGPQVRGGNILGQAYEGFGQLGKGGKARAASDAVTAARTSGVRDPLNRYTMTAAERRLYDANYRLEYARRTGTIPRSIGQNSADLFTKALPASPSDIAELELKLAVELSKVKLSPPSVQLLAKELGFTKAKIADATKKLSPKPPKPLGSGGGKKPPNTPKQTGGFADDPMPLSKEYLEASIGNLEYFDRLSIQSYASGSDQLINGSLRGTLPSTSEIDAHIVNIDGVLSRNPIPHTTTLYRSSGAEWISANSIDDLESMIGESVGWQNYISTTVNREMVDLPHFGPVDYELIIPAGTPGAYINVYSKYTIEEELLLGRGLNGKIVDVVTDEISGRKRVFIQISELGN